MRTGKTTSTSGGKRRLKIGAAGLLLGLLAGQHALANEARAASLVLLPIKLLDTSGEPTDQASQHAGRLIGMADELATDLSHSGLYRATAISADQLRNGCPTESVPCLLKFAQAQGADAIFIGVVHKSSTLIMQLWARLVDARTGRDIYTRDLNFRGDNDEAWRRAERFLAEQIRDGMPKPR
jgi:hypothetical protein